MPPNWIGGRPPAGVKTLHLCVCGSRTFDDYKLLERILDRLTVWYENVEVHHGGADGADTLANRWAERNWWVRHVYHPDWDRFGKGAGPIRNRQMAKAVAALGGRLVCFWDGKSPGTKDMIRQARKHLPESHITVVRTDRCRGKRRKSTSR